MLKKKDYENFLTQKTTPKSQKSLYKNLMKLDASKLQFTPVELDDDDNAFVKLTPAQMNNISKVQCLVVPVIEDGDSSFGLGDKGAVILWSSDDINVDWQKGIITENFRAVYPTLNGQRVYMELTNSGADYKVYSIPAIIEGEQHTLTLMHKLSTNQYIIALEAKIDNGYVVEQGGDIKEGTEITPLFLAAVPEDSISDDAEFKEIFKFTSGCL